jgi:hypothetical protein
MGVPLGWRLPLPQACMTWSSGDVRFYLGWMPCPNVCAAYQSTPRGVNSIDGRSLE